MIVGEFERAYKGPFHDFLEMESDWNDTRNSFDTFQGRGFERPYYPDGSSSLHFVENFHMVRYWGLVIIP